MEHFDRAVRQSIARLRQCSAMIRGTPPLWPLWWSVLAPARRRRPGSSGHSHANPARSPIPSRVRSSTWTNGAAAMPRRWSGVASRPEARRDRAERPAAGPGAHPARAIPDRRHQIRLAALERCRARRRCRDRGGLARRLPATDARQCGVTSGKGKGIWGSQSLALSRRSIGTRCGRNRLTGP